MFLHVMKVLDSFALTLLIRLNLFPTDGAVGLYLLTGCLSKWLLRSAVAVREAAWWWQEALKRLNATPFLEALSPELISPW